MRRSLPLLLLVGILPGFNYLSADDWPQILGPDRNGSADGEQLFDQWGSQGPKRLWEHECGEGFAGVAVRDQRVFLYHRDAGQDILECLEAATGKQVWKKSFKAIYRGGVSSDRGPRCVPVVAGDSVYCYGAAGTLRRLLAKDGSLLWSRNLFDEFDANEGYFGAGSTPLVLKDRIVIVVGGRKGGIVAFDLDGKLLWTTPRDTASYSSPVALTYRERPCVACVSKMTFRIVDIKSGEILFDQEFGKRGPTVNAACPLISNDRVFLSAAYNIGARVIDLKTNRTVWSNDQSLSSQYSTAVLFKDHLYGCDGREDFGNGNLRCVRFSDGQVLWRKEGTGICHLIRVGDKALVWHVDGRLDLIQLDPKEYRQLDTAEIFKQNSKSLPALSNGRLFVRSNAEGRPGKLVCLQVGRSTK